MVSQTDKSDDLVDRSDEDDEERPGHLKSETLPAVIAPSGRREAFRAIRRQLSDDEISSPGALRLILDTLERADAEVAELRPYVDRFHDADKEAAVLREMLKGVKSIDIIFGLGVGLGGALLGLGPTLGLWPAVIGAILAGSVTIARIRQ